MERKAALGWISALDLDGPAATPIAATPDQSQAGRQRHHQKNISDPSVHMWDIHTMKCLLLLRGFHQRNVCVLDFSADGKSLVSVRGDDGHSIVVWDWKRGQKLATAREFVQTRNNLTFTGAINGDMWCDHFLLRVVAKAHTGPVFTMYTILRDGLIITSSKERP
ncbi:hypothetical protein INR49_028372 [Caranx melampygus]|nr:hypothetical protein INR49_028372 [Caranx melampygus]